MVQQGCWLVLRELFLQSLLTSRGRPTDVEASDSEPPGSEEHPIETDPTEEAAASSSNAEGKKPAFAKRLF